MAGICAGSLNSPISIVRPRLVSAAPGSADPVREYTTVLSPRAQVKTKGGSSEWSRVEINGRRVTHVFTIRFTRVPFDVRDMLQDPEGNLFAILQIEDVDEQHRWFRVYAAKLGDATAPAVQ